MSDLLKSTAKFAIGTCVTLCAVTVAASVAVGTDLGKVATAGFKGAKDAIKEELEAQRAKSKSDEEDATNVNEVAIEPLDEAKASEENFEN